MEKTLTIQNKAGLHARPASVFVQTAAKFNSTVSLSKDGRKVNAKSILSVMSLGVAMGDKVVLEAEGPDAAEAIKALAKMVEEKFGEE
ncbi:phosphotransferase system hpr histidine phosphorylation site [Lucifera butyrica]|uniref:Phosphocarrier protein HPr n=1 Tax=Lucifera butyrica TaxID=1351585 RepID=A0A498R647_9FIRM|nr:phosphotransferase system hpr histidine phosphorylation site [Lucifera butyrica]